VLSVTSGSTAIYPRSCRVTPWSKFSIHKLTVAKMDKFHYRTHNSSPPIPNLRQINPVYISHPVIFKCTRGSSKRSPSSKFFNQNLVNIFGRPLVCHMPSPSYPFLFGYTNGVRRGIKLIIKICVFCIIRNNFLPNEAKYRRATHCRLCATVQSTHSQPPSIYAARLPAQPEDLSCRCNRGSTEHVMA
jgi:hypothetical protein